MDPELQSILSSVALSAATAVAAWAASKGVIPNGDQPVLANQLVTVGFGAVAAAIAWYKKRQMSQAAMITAVNAAQNGVKVVAATPANAAVPQVDKPLK